MWKTAFWMLVVCGACRAVWGDIVAVRDVRIVARLTGVNSINETGSVGVGGTDLGHMVNHQGKTYFLFGDTYDSETPDEFGGWRWNAMAYSTDTTPSDGIIFDGWLTGSSVHGHPEWARQVINTNAPLPERITEIPTGAVSLQNRIYAWFMSVNMWGLPGIWTANYGGLAYWQEGDPTFTVVPDFQFPHWSNFCMVAASLRTDLPPGQDDYLYLWGTQTGRLGGVKLARVHPSSVADRSAYRYFRGFDGNGQPIWYTNEARCPWIVWPTVGEMSVMYNPAASAWTMLYVSRSADAIELREAPEPWGPWSLPVTVVSRQFPQFRNSYGTYMNPLYIEDGGRTIYFTMSRWDPYDVYLVRATLVLGTRGRGCVCTPCCPILRQRLLARSHRHDCRPKEQARKRPLGRLLRDRRTIRRF